MEEKELKYRPLLADKHQAHQCQKMRKWNMKHRRITERRRQKWNSICG